MYIKQRKSGIYTAQFQEHHDAPQQQHFVPNVHLRNFALKKKRVWVYRKGVAPVLTLTKKIATERNFNEYSLGQEQSNRALEEALGILETHAGTIIPKIAAGVKLSAEEISWMSSYFGSLILRTRKVRHELMRPMAEKLFEKKRVDPSLISSIQEEVARKGQIIGREEIARILKIRSDELLSQPAYLHFLGWEEIVLKLAEHISKRVWQVVRAPSGYAFVTSDSPISFFEMTPAGAVLSTGLSSETINCFLAIGPELGLIMRPANGGEWLHNLDETTVGALNECMVRSAHQEVYGATKETQTEEMVNRLINTLTFDTSRIDTLLETVEP